MMVGCQLRMSPVSDQYSWAWFSLQEVDQTQYIHLKSNAASFTLWPSSAGETPSRCVYDWDPTPYTLLVPFWIFWYNHLHCGFSFHNLDPSVSFWNFFPHNSDSSVSSLRLLVFWSVPVWISCSLHLVHICHLYTALSLASYSSLCLYPTEVMFLVFLSSSSLIHFLVLTKYIFTYLMKEGCKGEVNIEILYIWKCLSSYLIIWVKNFKLETIFFQNFQQCSLIPTSNFDIEKIEAIHFSFLFTSNLCQGQKPFRFLMFCIWLFFFFPSLDASDIFLLPPVLWNFAVSIFNPLHCHSIDHMYLEIRILQCWKIS